MAPLPEGSSSFYISHIRSWIPLSAPPTSSDLAPQTTSLVAHGRSLLPRTTPANLGAGVTPPDAIPNRMIFVVFGLIGAGFVCTGIWFFFFAKNGGFYFKETDWDDYKSTVLRRKGPNGTTLSGATESTDLGGGSIVHGDDSEKGSKWGRKKKGIKRYKDYDEDTSQASSTLASQTRAEEMSEIKNDARREKKRKSKKQRSKKTALSDVDTVTDTMTMDEGMEAAVRDDLIAYRHEKPARVGGLNKESDASTFDGSTNYNSTASSDLLSHREKTPTSTPTKMRRERKANSHSHSHSHQHSHQHSQSSSHSPSDSPSHSPSHSQAVSIRKVFSTSNGGSISNHWSAAPSLDSPQIKRPLLPAPEYDRIKIEARKLQEKGRAAQRRNFSFQAGDDSTVACSDDRIARREKRQQRRANRSPTKLLPGNHYEESEMGTCMGSDVGTKTYHHPIPGLSTASRVGTTDYVEEKRKNRISGGN